MIFISHLGNFSGVRYFTPLAPLGVSLFLICSGYGLSESFNKAALTNFMRKRIKRLFYPYWLILFFYVGALLLMQSPASFRQTGLYAVLWELPTGMYWYLQFIVFWYILFYSCCRIMTDIQHRVAALCAVSVLVVMISNNPLMTEQAFFFPLGAALSLKKIYIERLLQQKRTALVSVIGLGVAALALLMLKQLPPVRAELGSQAVYLLVQTPMLAAGSLAIIVGANKIVPLQYFEGIAFLGNYSYEIYLTHAILLQFITPRTLFPGISGIIIVLSLLLSMGLKRLVHLTIYHREIAAGQLPDA
jgi:peptidoglycan/LPS O-acetylase OafA/YrhL